MNKLLIKSLFVTSIFVSLMACDTGLSGDEIAWKAFRNGKAVAVMRHAFAPVDEDNSGLTRDVCQDERNLSQEGRDQADYIGQAIRAKGIASANVYSSSLCRCFDTAELLGFGDPVLLPTINSFYLNKDQQDKGRKQTADLIAWIKQAIQTNNTSNILVTHGFNISTMTGDFVDEGDFLLIGLVDGELVTLSNVVAELL